VVCETPDVTAKALASGLDNSGWMKHIKAVLDTSVFIAKVLYYVLHKHVQFDSAALGQCSKYNCQGGYEWKGWKMMTMTVIKLEKVIHMISTFKFCKSNYICVLHCHTYFFCGKSSH